MNSIRRKLIIGFFLICLLLGTSVSAFGIATLKWSKPAQLTNFASYDRNPAVMKANDGKWWLFFAKGRDSRNVRDFNGYNPDLDYYDIYFKTAKTLPKLANASAYNLSDIITPPDNAQRDICAFQTGNGTIFVFTSTGLGPGSERSVIYYTYAQHSWSGPYTVPNTDYAAHIHVIHKKGTIWVFYDVGYTIYETSFKAGVWGTPELITENATLGKAILSKGTFYLVWSHVNESESVWGDYIGLSTSRYPGGEWKNQGSVAAYPGATNWDPVLIRYSDSYRLFWAPDTGADGQFLATTSSPTPGKSDSWSIPQPVTSSNYGGTSWWDFWPGPVITENGKLKLVYTSERNASGTGMTDANIWLISSG